VLLFMNMGTSGCAFGEKLLGFILVRTLPHFLF
jgi:hypothetical protein